jgi:hypothetical protein
LSNSSRSVNRRPRSMAARRGEPLMGADVNVRCPRCGYGGLRPARPRWYDGIRLALTRSKPYRCVAAVPDAGGGLNRCRRGDDCAHR